MKISVALAQASSELSTKGVSNSKLDALILLSYALSFTKEQIIFNPDLEMDAAQQKAFFGLIARRANREPVSHIIAKREFYGEDFFVNSDVLDPRPDSESLIELVLKNFPDKERKLKLLEVGVGSGCLIITLLRAYAQATAIAVDISKKALEIAQKNAVAHNVQDRLDLIESDLFNAVAEEEKFDLIISNPPYIPSEEIEFLQEEVKNHEPRSALDGGLDGYNFYHYISNQAKKFLSKEGQIIVEIGFGQEEKVIDIFVKNDFIFNGSKLDLSGVTRVLSFS